MSEEAIHRINDENDLQYLIESLRGGQHFAARFQFRTQELFDALLKTLDIDAAEFEKTWYYISEDNNIHVSLSEGQYCLISNMGLISGGKYTDNPYMNAYASQHWVLITLLREVKRIVDNESPFDVDSYYYEQIKIITPALFHNIVFYYELLCKVYLSLSGKTPKMGHSINERFHEVMQSMYQQHHNNTLFHSYLVRDIRELAHYILSIPGEFREANIKYDANSTDNTTIDLSSKRIKQLIDRVTIFYDCIHDYYDSKNDSFYFKPGLYERLLSKAKTAEERDRIQCEYGFLLKKQEEV